MNDDNLSSDTQQKRSLDDILAKVKQRHDERLIKEGETPDGDSTPQESKIALSPTGELNIPSQLKEDPVRAFEGVRKTQDPPTIYERRTPPEVIDLSQKLPKNDVVGSTKPIEVDTKSKPQSVVTDPHSTTYVPKSPEPTQEPLASALPTMQESKTSTTPSQTQVDIQITYPIEVVEDVLAGRI
jgi:hypothetical protein